MPRRQDDNRRADLRGQQPQQHSQQTEQDPQQGAFDARQFLGRPAQPIVRDGVYAPGQAPQQPTMIGYLAAQRVRDGGTGTPAGGSPRQQTPRVQPIGREQIQQAELIRLRYKQGKAHLEQRIIESEEWYKLRNWECMRDKKREIQPTSAWLFNVIANKHADAMDAIPGPTVLAREESDKEEAKRLTSIIPVILDQNDFEDTYDKVTMYKLRTGTGVYGVFWDPEKLNGLGDISVTKVDILNLFWAPGVTDIQDSPNLFFVRPQDNSALIAQYPELEGRLGGDTSTVTKYQYDESIDMSDKTDVVEWYYKRKQPNGRTVLHYCKYVGDNVIFATENDPAYAETGWYEHGQYPFVLDVLFPVEGMPTGFGYVDLGKDVQQYIDRASQSIMENLLANARPRHFINSSGNVNEKEYADITQDFVHVDGNLGQDSILPIKGTTLPSIYYEILQGKIDELKETTGNRDVSNGGVTSGATAASAIAAMQEAGGKLSRDHSKSAYRAYRKMILMVIELIRQFYELPRQFRIIGADGAEEYISYVNAGLKPAPQDSYDLELGHRLPLMDVKVGAQKASPYSKMAQNELAIQLYQLGMFAPEMAPQAVIALRLMDFYGKDEVLQRVGMNGDLMQVIQALQAQIAAMQGMTPTGEMGGSPAPGGATGPLPESDDLGGMAAKESAVTRKARQNAAERVQP